MTDPTFDDADTAFLARIDATDPLADTAMLAPLRGTGTAAPVANPPAAAPPNPPNAVGPPGMATDTAVLAPMTAGGAADTVMLGRVPASTPLGGPAPAGPPVRPVPPAVGWWRRNRWGLVALVPALALALGPGLKDGYDLINRLEPRQAVPVTADGWASLNGTRLRLVELAEVTEPTRNGGSVSRPLRLPPGIRAWRARIAFETTNPESVQGCQMSLESRDGRLFDADPDELSDAYLPLASCTPPDDGDGPTYETEAYFALPDGVGPAAIHVAVSTAFPRYARLAPA